MWSNPSPGNQASKIYSNRYRIHAALPQIDEIPMKDLTHIDSDGQARMVDVGRKPIVRREAMACGEFVAAKETLDRIVAGNLPKGDALAVARIAAIAAAKRTDELIPLCHTLPLDQVEIEFERVADDRLRVTATSRVSARTGVEMESLVAVAAACLTLYDMTKAVDKALKIESVHLVKKTKGA